jgi:hypothetical protein
MILPSACRPKSSLLLSFSDKNFVYIFHILPLISLVSIVLCVQTGSGAHPAFCTMGTGGPFPGAKAWPGRDADHHPHLVPRSRMSRIYTSCAFVACGGTVFFNF